MKKTLGIGIFVFFLCSLMLTGIVCAGNSAYSISEYWLANPTVIDGKWTTTNEWTDTGHTFMTGNATGKFAYKADINSGTYATIFIIEMLGDNTNNTGDYVQLCLDNDNTATTAPTSTCYMVQIDGNRNLTLYQGTGSGWTAVSRSELTWAETLGTSMWSSTPHWIIEIQDSSKIDGIIQTGQPPNGLRVAAYDASNTQFAAWAPNSNANVPSTWGVIADYQSTIPEGLSAGTTVGLILLLASAVTLATFIHLRRRP
jgi:hypothetical protein